jgi:hypothetical protein
MTTWSRGDGGAAKRAVGPGVSRRAVLGGLAASMVVGRRAAAFGETTLVDVVELDLGPGTLSRPNAWRGLLYEMTRLTSVECATTSVRVAADDPAMFEHPFAVLSGDGAFADPSDTAVKQLEQYLAYGGFLFIDDTTGTDGSGFDRCVRRLMSRVFPTRPFALIPPDHSVNRAFFLLTGCPGRLAVHPYLEGITAGTLAPVIYCRNDISGALDRTDSGAAVAACVPGGERQRTEALKLGVNLFMYSLTADYKSDQAHIRQLMLERRIK